MAKNSWPSSLAIFSAFALSPSVMAMIRLLISRMSDHGKPWATESESTPSLPSIAINLSTKPRIGSRVVWNTPIIPVLFVAMAIASGSAVASLLAGLGAPTSRHPTAAQGGG